MDPPFLLMWITSPCLAAYFFVFHLPTHHFLWYNILVRSRSLHNRAPLWNGCLPLSVVRQNSLADRRISFLCPFLLPEVLGSPSHKAVTEYPLSASAGNGISSHYNPHGSRAGYHTEYFLEVEPRVFYLPPPPSCTCKFLRILPLYHQVRKPLECLCFFFQSFREPFKCFRFTVIFTDIFYFIFYKLRSDTDNKAIPKHQFCFQNMVVIYFISFSSRGPLFITFFMQCGQCLSGKWNSPVASKISSQYSSRNLAPSNFRLCKSARIMLFLSRSSSPVSSLDRNSLMVT